LNTKPDAPRLPYLSPLAREGADGQAVVCLRIPIYSGRVFRREAGHHSEMKPAGIPINFRPGF
jgi:hypothetical protein